MVVPGNNDTAYHSSPRENTDPGSWLSETAFLTTAVSPIMPETPFNIADSVSDLDSHRSPAQAIYSLDCTIRPPPHGHAWPSRSRADLRGSGYRGPWPQNRPPHPPSRRSPPAR